MHLTVAVCTWNRAKILEQTLMQLQSLRIPPGVEWELLVVNNNSSDNTDEVIEKHSRILPLRRLFEPTPGKSHALNRAVKNAQGEYMLWTDDDVFVDKNWISAYCDAFKRHPGAAFFGGPIEPLFAGTPPQWLQTTWRQIGSVYGRLNLGEQPIRFDHRLLPYGANMAVHMSEQRRYVYDTNLGRKPNRLVPGEEVKLLREMLADGLEGWWVPDASVRHYAPKRHQTIQFIRGRLFGQGQLEGLQGLDKGDPKLFGRPRWLWRRAIEAEMRYRFGRFLCPPEVWIEDLRTASHAWGRLRAHALLGSDMGSYWTNFIRRKTT